RDAAGRIYEPMAHQRLHSGMDVTVQLQRIDRMWHRAWRQLMLAQKLREQGAVRGARALPPDCYMDTSGVVYGPVRQAEIVPVTDAEPELEADNVEPMAEPPPAIGKTEQCAKQQEKGGHSFRFDVGHATHAVKEWTGSTPTPFAPPGWTSMTVVSSC
ncbi:MAG TPA: hypothetical protein VF678_03460, partial [bacterium]